MRTSKSDTSLTDSFVIVPDARKRPINPQSVLRSGKADTLPSVCVCHMWLITLVTGFKWQRQLVFRSKLTMHTAYDRKDNAEPASVTALAVSKYVVNTYSVCLWVSPTTNICIILLGITVVCLWVMHVAECSRGVCVRCPAGLPITGWRMRVPTSVRDVVCVSHCMKGNTTAGIAARYSVQSAVALRVKYLGCVYWNRYVSVRVVTLRYAQIRIVKW